METKKQNIPIGKKGGRSPFGKIALTAGGLTVGATVTEAINRWRSEHPETTDEENKQNVQDSEVIDDEKLAQNGENVNSTQQEQQTEVKNEPEEPQPIDPEEPQNLEPNEGQRTEEPVDEIAQRIAESEEIDPVDDNFVAFMNVGEHRVLYTENGEVDVFDIEINDPQLAGYPFMIADTDGDGFYDSILLADGSPANIVLGSEPGAPTLDSFLAQAGVSQSDLEEMHETGGGHLDPDNNNVVAQNNDDPTKDMIDEDGNKVTNGQIAQNDQPALDEDEDEAYYIALLTQLLEEDDDDEEEEVINEDDEEDDDDTELEFEEEDFA